MSYATFSDLRQRLGVDMYARLTDRAAGKTADDTVGAGLITTAESLLDSYFARHYATPLDLTEHPELATTVQARTLDLAEFYAWRGTPFVSDIPDRVRVLYDDALRWLEQIARAELVLPSVARPAESTGRVQTPAQVRSESRQFTRDELDGL